MRRAKEEPIGEQVKARVTSKVKKKSEYDGDIGNMVSTGSTLLDLAISGGRVRGGGLPGGIFVEIFGPSGSGKTVLLCEIAGDIQRKGGDIMFHDPEARLNKVFANIFDLDTDDMDYSTPNTVTEVFKAIRNWEPQDKCINGVLTDSLAALSTDLEMDEDDGDKMGMRRAKEFSEQLRKTARFLTESNLILVCSNQIRENLDAGKFGQKELAPGGKAIGFYSSLRLRTSGATKLKRKIKFRGKEHFKVYGVSTVIEVYKSSLWKPHRTAPVTIDFDYGIDDIRENLKYFKQFTGATVYMVGDIKLDKSLEKSIAMVEEDDLQDQLKEAVIDLWEEMEAKFDVERKPKKR